MYLNHKLPARLSRQGIFNLDREYPDSNDYKLGYLSDFCFNDGEFTGAIKITDKIYYDVEEGDFEIILRPLSDLIKEIDHNGEKIIPIVELAKLTHIKENHIAEISQSVKGTCDGVKYSFGFYNGSFWMKRLRGTKWVDNAVFNQDELFDKLNEYHFDWKYDLIKKKLAIDINTL